MENEEHLDGQNTGQHCRLCLHWTDDSLCAEQMVDISSFNKSLNSTLADKIRDCLGLYINPGDTVTNICLNCVNTISFIDEFRFLCRQTEEIYESTQFRFNDVSRWQCYNDHVSELRTLVRDQRDWVDNILDSTRMEDSIVTADTMDSIFSPEFIKVEEGEDEDEIELIEETVHEEYLSEGDEKVDSIEPILLEIAGSLDNNPTAVSERDSRFLLKLKIAKELHSQVSKKPDFRAVGKKLNLGVHEVKLLWRTMKNHYRRYKKQAYEGHEASIFRCRKCPLFTLLNTLVPKYDGDQPYKEPKISSEKYNDGGRLSLDLKVAIVEEIKAHPELWDISRNSSAHSMKVAWEEMTRKFEMDIQTMRTHWHRLREVYRSYKVRERKGIRKRYPANEKYDYLISLLHDVFGGAMSIRFSEESTPQTITPEVEVVELVEEKIDNDEIGPKDHHLALALEIQKHPIIWCYKHPDFHSFELRDITWEKIAEIFATDCESVKRDWRWIKDAFRNRHSRHLKAQHQSNDVQVIEPLYEVLNEMFQENTQMGSKDEETTEAKTVESELDEEKDSDKKFNHKTLLEFAKVCHYNEFLWNTKHPDYNTLDKRNEVWDLIALQFGVSMEKIKQEWKTLRGIYRSRCLRLQKGLIKKNDKILKTPLHQLLKSMFEDHMLVGMRSLGVFPKGFKRSDAIKKNSIEEEPFSALEDRMKLVEEIALHDLLWNPTNPNYKKSAHREGVFMEIAAKLSQPLSAIKTEWKKLRTTHQHRQLRIARGRLDPNQDAVDPLHALMDKLFAAPNDETPINGLREYPKRRFTGKRSFSDDGCIKINVNGTLRYAKVCELCGKQVERSYFEYHMNGHYGLTPFACSFEGCDKQYSNKITRDRHEVVVHGEDGYVFQCDQCDLKFKQKAKYEYHYAIKHKSDEVPCDICGKVLKHRNLLRKHKDTHVANYECQVCGKVLQKKYTLNVHMRVHTKEKPYPCELCDQRFMLKVQMKTHLLKVHGFTWEEFQAASTSNIS